MRRIVLTGPDTYDKFVLLLSQDPLSNLFVLTERRFFKTNFGNEESKKFMVADEMFSFLQDKMHDKVDAMLALGWIKVSEVKGVAALPDYSE